MRPSRVWRKACSASAGGIVNGVKGMFITEPWLVKIGGSLEHLKSREHIDRMRLVSDRLMDAGWRIDDDAPGWLWRNADKTPNRIKVEMEIWWIFHGFRSGLGEAFLRSVR